MMYESGIFVDESPAIAEELYRKSVDTGNAEAYVLLGSLKIAQVLSLFFHLVLRI